MGRGCKDVKGGGGKKNPAYMPNCPLPSSSIPSLYFPRCLPTAIPSAGYQVPTEYKISQQMDDSCRVLSSGEA